MPDSTNGRPLEFDGRLLLWLEIFDSSSLGQAGQKGKCARLLDLEKLQKYSFHFLCFFSVFRVAHLSFDSIYKLSLIFPVRSNNGRNKLFDYPLLRKAFSFFGGSRQLECVSENQQRQQG
jgi:hypothetical protein